MTERQVSLSLGLMRRFSELHNLFSVGWLVGWRPQSRRLLLLVNNPVPLVCALWNGPVLPPRSVCFRLTWVASDSAYTQQKPLEESPSEKTRASRRWRPNEISESSQSKVRISRKTQCWRKAFNGAVAMPQKSSQSRELLRR